MPQNAFSVLADKYDMYNSADFNGYIRFFRQCIQRHSDIEVKEVLDMACGTGELTKRLCDCGYDVCAFDLSEDMLAVATEKCVGLGVAFSLQDMRSFELYGTVQATLCSYDSLNYLENGLGDCFSLVNNYTQRGGLFVFDVNTLYRYEKVFGDNAYVYESDGSMLVWQNWFNRSTGKCRFYLTEFTEEDGVYLRSDEVQTQRYYSVAGIKRLLKQNGFELCAVYGDFDCKPLTDTSEKAYFVAKSVGGKAQG